MGDLPDGFLLPSVVKAGKAFLTPKIVPSNSISKHTWHLLHRRVILTFSPIFWKEKGSRTGTSRSLPPSLLGWNAASPGSGTYLLAHDISTVGGFGSPDVPTLLFRPCAQKPGLIF